MFYEVIRPRVGETDALGYINNTVIPQWFEGARNPIYKLFNTDFNLSLNQWNLTLAKTAIEFLIPLEFGEDVEIKTFIGRIGSSSGDIYQECWQKNQKKVSGTATMVYIDLEARKSMPIPYDIKQKVHVHYFTPAL